MMLLLKKDHEYFEVKARGKLNVKAAEQINKQLSRWIIIDCVRATRKQSNYFDNCYLSYRFKRAPDFR